MTLEETQLEVISEFEIFDDWMDKYNFLIEQSKELVLVDPKYKTNEYIIEGCQSKVWLRADYENGKVIYTADSDAIITKGIIALLIRILSNRKPDEIINANLDFIDKTGLRQNLSPTRSNGLLSMIKQMKLYAIAYKAKNE